MSKLVTFKANWADEMDVAGLDIWTDAEWKAFLASDYYPTEYYIGTNQEMEIESLKDWKNKFTVKTLIDEGQVDKLRSLIDFPFGHFPEAYLLSEEEDDD